ncbi:hypothetical protein OFC13_30075, partial [Escherichia coli]|nr:hypothetical protein [Escherichia coli]
MNVRRIVLVDAVSAIIPVNEAGGWIAEQKTGDARTIERTLPSIGVLLREAIGETELAVCTSRTHGCARDARPL